MPTATAGNAIGDLIVASDAPDTVSKVVKLAGAVLRHASPSWDSLASVPVTSIDLGATFPGAWQVRDVRVFSRGFDALRALLELGTPSVTGGDGRFSVAAGLPASVGAAHVLHPLRRRGCDPGLDVRGDARHSAADEDDPGATPLASLQAAIRVTLFSGSTDAPPTGVSALRFLAPRPNPVSRATHFAFELPSEATVSLEVFDLGGRRVANLASGDFGTGRHERSWNATDERGGRVPGGLYFARFRTRGLDRTERVVVLPWFAGRRVDRRSVRRSNTAPCGSRRSDARREVRPRRGRLQGDRQLRLDSSATASGPAGS